MMRQQLKNVAPTAVGCASPARPARGAVANRSWCCCTSSAAYLPSGEPLLQRQCIAENQVAPLSFQPAAWVAD